MPQKRFFNFKDADSTANLISFISTFFSSGLYRGYDIQVNGNTIYVTHTNTGISLIDENLAATNQYGLAVTRQGTIVLDDTNYTLTVTNNSNSVTRVDALILSHAYSNTVIGGTLALLTLIENYQVGSLSNDQTLLYELVHAPNSLAADAAIYKVLSPDFAGDTTIAHKDRVNNFLEFNSFTLQGSVVNIAYLDPSDSFIDFANSQGSFYVLTTAGSPPLDRWDGVKGFKNFDITGDVQNYQSDIKFYCYGNYTFHAPFFQGDFENRDSIPIKNGSTITVSTDIVGSAYIVNGGNKSLTSTNISNSADYGICGLAEYDASTNSINIDWKHKHYVLNINSVGGLFQPLIHIKRINKPPIYLLATDVIMPDNFYGEFTLEIPSINALCDRFKIGDGTDPYSIPFTGYGFVDFLPKLYSEVNAQDYVNTVYTVRLFYLELQGTPNVPTLQLEACNRGHVYYKSSKNVSNYLLTGANINTLLPAGNLVPIATRSVVNYFTYTTSILETTNLYGLVTLEVPQVFNNINAASPADSVFSYLMLQPNSATNITLAARSIIYIMPLSALDLDKVVLTFNNAYLQTGTTLTRVEIEILSLYNPILNAMCLAVRLHTAVILSNVRKLWLPAKLL